MPNLCARRRMSSFVRVPNDRPELRRCRYKSDFTGCIVFSGVEVLSRMKTLLIRWQAKGQGNSNLQIEAMYFLV